MEGCLGIGQQSVIATRAAADGSDESNETDGRER